MHPHADKMAEYARDAAETDRPWERWQFYDEELGWLSCKGHPPWKTTTRYRRKPQRWEPRGGPFWVTSSLQVKWDLSSCPNRVAGMERQSYGEAEDIARLLRRVARLHAWRCENGYQGSFTVAWSRRAKEWIPVGPLDEPSKFTPHSGPADVMMTKNTAGRCAKALNSGELVLDPEEEE